MTNATLTTINLDCADPGALAEFYREVLGWPVTDTSEDAVFLGEGPVQLALQKVDGYQPPGWPDPRKQAHLDFSVDDVEVAVERLVALGAEVPDFQPGAGDWVVLTDPAGHPFCIAAA